VNILSSWLNFGKRQSNSALMSIDTARKIVRDYAKFMEKSTPLPGCIADIEPLPHPKQRIKDAIGISLRATRDEILVDELKCGYLMLSAWQDGVGSQTLGLDFTSLDLDCDPVLLAEKIQNHSNTIESWKPMIETDQRSLRKEFERLINQALEAY